MEASIRPSPAIARLPSLDGLRGLAAAVVVLHHSLLLIPGFADQYFSRSMPIDRGDVVWYLTYTPAHLVWAGSEAVLVFFVLSGLVVALPAMYKPRFNWRGYYPARLLRLYLPMWGAVLFTLVTILLVPRYVSESFGEWVPIHRLIYDPKNFVLDMLQLSPIAKSANSPLWSLRFEIYFSLLLPLFIVTARPWPRLIFLKVVVGCLIISLANMTENATIGFLTVFWLGTAMAASWAQISSWGAALNANRFSGLLWWSIGLFAIFALSAPWLLTPTQHLARGDFGGVVALGAVASIFVAMHAEGFRRLLCTSFFAWLGRVSFSVYLIHEPIILAFRYRFPTAPPTLLAFAGVITSFVAAEIFYRSVEGPSHRLSRRVNRWVTQNDRRNGGHAADSRPTEDRYTT